MFSEDPTFAYGKACIENEIRTQKIANVLKEISKLRFYSLQKHQKLNDKKKTFRRIDVFNIFMTEEKMFFVSINLIFVLMSECE